MRPLRLRLRDFGSFADADLDLSAVQLANVVGSNGAGKTTLTDAVRVALFGASAGRLDGYVRQGASRFRVELDFEVDGAHYTVVRAQSSAQKAELYRDDEAVCEPKVREVDSAIEAILGVGYDDFTLAYWLPQGGLGTFARMDPAERKSWLGDVLPLEGWRELEERAKVERSAHEEERARLQGALDAHRRQLESYEGVDDESLRAAESRDMAHERLTGAEEGLQDAQRLLESAQEASREHDQAVEARNKVIVKREEAEARMKQRVAEVDDRRKDVVASHDLDADVGDVSVADVDSLIATEEADLDTAKQADQEKRGVENELRETEAALMAERKAFGVAESDLAAHKESSPPACPNCGYVLDDDYEERGAALQTKRDDAEEEVLHLESVCNSLRSRVSEASPPRAVEDIEAELRTLRERHRKVMDAERAKDARSTAQRGLLDAEERLREADREVAALDDEIGELLEQAVTTEHPAKTAEAARERVVASEQDVKRHRAELADAERSLATVTERVQARDWLTAHIEQAEADIEEHATEQTRYDLLAKAYSKNGIQARLIEKAVALVEQSANEFLARFTGGLTLAFESQRENKTGGMRETLDIMVVDSLGSRPIERYSGGESTRIHFALAVGLARLLAHFRDGARVDSFVVDEPEYLDGEGVGELVRCLHVLSERFSTVWLISHVKDATEQMPQSIRVVKGADGSSVEVVA